MSDTTEWGIAMESCNQIIIDEVKEYLKDIDSSVLYIEIGVAEGKTLIQICNILSDFANIHYEALGVDIEDGWSLNLEELNKNVEKYSHPITLSFLGSPKVFEVKAVKEMVDSFKHLIVFIDGDHSYEGVKKDFEAIEAILNNSDKKALLLFHDSGDKEQGFAVKYLPKGIEVRKFLKDAGLLDGSNKKYKTVCDFQNDNENGNGIFITKREN